MEVSSDNTLVSKENQNRGNSIFKAGLFLLGSYMIALLLSTAVHELGHVLALASIPINSRLVLNPFSISMTVPLSSIPPQYMALMLSSGTISELIFGTLVMAILWHWRSSNLAPLLMLAPLSYLKSAGYFIVGIAIPDGDTALLMALGVPALIIQALGVFMLVFGIILLILIFPLLGLSREDSSKKVFAILFLGLVFHGVGMITFALMFNPVELSIGIANVVSMIMTVTLLTILFVKRGHIFEKIARSEVALLKRPVVLSIASMALILIITELIFLN